MALPPGTRIGPYEIAAQIREGGMGEVYRARDTKFDRDVAIKVLSASLASDADRILPASSAKPRRSPARTIRTTPPSRAR